MPCKSWNSIEFHGILWTSIGFNGIPWNWSAMKSTGFHRIPWNSVEFCVTPWNSMKTHGLPWNSAEHQSMSWGSVRFHGKSNGTFHKIQLVKPGFQLVRPEPTWPDSNQLGATASIWFGQTRIQLAWPGEPAVLARIQLAWPAETSWLGPPAADSWQPDWHPAAGPASSSRPHSQQRDRLCVQGGGVGRKA